MNIELKDYFAAKAMQGILSSKPTLPSIDYLVSMSYGIAQKMIECRHKLLAPERVQSSKQIEQKSVDFY